MDHIYICIFLLFYLEEKRHIDNEEEEDDDDVINASQDLFGNNKDYDKSNEPANGSQSLLSPPAPRASTPPPPPHHSTPLLEPRTPTRSSRPKVGMKAPRSKYMATINARNSQVYI